LEIDDRVRLNMLYDFYSNLLTPRQKELFELRFQYDLSLGEIADNLEISRQAVNDLLRRTAAQLNNYEERLHLLAKHRQRTDIIARLEEVLTAGDTASASNWLSELKKI
jgi:predicted DNA-binding protein YlxM (UPF0122 family)